MSKMPFDNSARIRTKKGKFVVSPCIRIPVSWGFSGQNIKFQEYYNISIMIKLFIKVSLGSNINSADILDSINFINFFFWKKWYLLLIFSLSHKNLTFSLLFPHQLVWSKLYFHRALYSIHGARIYWKELILKMFSPVRY